jgi:hypothetical protein
MRFLCRNPLIPRGVWEQSWDKGKNFVQESNNPKFQVGGVRQQELRVTFFRSCEKIDEPYGKIHFGRFFSTWVEPLSSSSYSLVKQHALEKLPSQVLRNVSECSAHGPRPRLAGPFWHPGVPLPGMHISMRGLYWRVLRAIIALRHVANGVF